MKNNIHSLKELRREKELLKAKMELTKSAFKMSLGNNRREVKNLLINRIALPVGLGAAVSLVTQALGKAKTKHEDQQEVMAAEMPVESSHETPWWVAPSLKLITALGVYLKSLLQQKEPDDQMAQDVSSHNGVEGDTSLET